MWRWGGIVGLCESQGRIVSQYVLNFTHVCFMLQMLLLDVCWVQYFLSIKIN